MGARSHGPRRKTRKKLTKPVRLKGKISIARSVQEFKPGDRVIIKPEPAVQKGMPFKRFFGRLGVIREQRGKAYVIELKDGNLIKDIISLPIHLRRA